MDQRVKNRPDSTELRDSLSSMQEDVDNIDVEEPLSNIDNFNDAKDGFDDLSSILYKNSF